LFEYLTEKESKVERRRDELDGAAAAGAGNSHAASPSGAATGPETARRRGGVPIEAETRATKRKAEEEAERQVETSTDETRARGVKTSLGESLDGWED
jgi:hypothetical protein